MTLQSRAAAQNGRGTDWVRQWSFWALAHGPSSCFEQSGGYNIVCLLGLSFAPSLGICLFSTRTVYGFISTFYVGYIWNFTWHMMLQARLPMSNHCGARQASISRDLVLCSFVVGLKLALDSIENGHKVLFLTIPSSSCFFLFGLIFIFILTF